MTKVVDEAGGMANGRVRVGVSSNVTTFDHGLKQTSRGEGAGELEFSADPPIVWCRENAPENTRGRQVRTADGRIEKTPRFAHKGPHNDHDIHPDAQNHFRREMRGDGNEAFHVMTNGSAHLVGTTVERGIWARDPYTQEQIRKSYVTGCVPLDFRAPLCELVRAGVVNPRALVTAPTCEHTAADVDERGMCECIRLEQAARLAASKAIDDERAQRSLAVENPDVTTLARAMATALDERDAKRKGKS